MRYPTIGRSRATEAARTLLSGARPDFESYVQVLGAGEDLEQAALEDLAATVASGLAEFRKTRNSDRDLLEGHLTSAVHAALVRFPIEVRDDPGFWRFLSVRYLWDFIVWRESNTFESGDPAKYLKYIDGTAPAECVAMRMYLRGQIALENGSYELAWAVPKGTDFWRSHILRVRTSSAPVISRAFVREQATSRMATDELRDYARRLNRLRTNLVLNVYDRNEAEDLIKELRAT